MKVESELESYLCPSSMVYSSRVHAKSFNKSKISNKRCSFTPNQCSRQQSCQQDDLIVSNTKHHTSHMSKPKCNLSYDASFKEQLEELANVIRNKRFSRSSKNINQYSHDLIKGTEANNKYTNSEDIYDFYEYTEDCLRLLPSLPPKQSSLPSVSFNLDKNKKIAVFDVDETLVHCTGKITDNNKSDNVIQVTLPSKKTAMLGINIRPNWKEALDIIKEYYNIITYTASHSSYADAVLDYLDPDKQYFNFRLYRNNCVETVLNNKKIYIKDLDILKQYDLKNIVIIDNSVLSFAYHLDSGIPIVPYYESDNDNELVILAYYLKRISSYDDLRQANKEHIKLDELVEKAKEEEDTSDEDSEFCLVEEKVTKGRRISQIGLCLKNAYDNMQAMHESAVNVK